MKDSKKYALNKKDLESLGRGLFITLLGALLTFIADNIPNIDFGVYTPFVVAFSALFVNTLRKYIAGR